MTDKELRELRDANRNDEVLVSIINRLIRTRRNGQHAVAERLEGRIVQWRRDHIAVVS